MSGKAHTPESQVLEDCLRYLQVRGIYHWRNNVGAVRLGPGRFMRFGLKGSSDILGILPNGRFLAVECKAQSGRLSGEQGEFLEAVEKLGGLAVVCRGWEELDAALRREGYAVDGPLFNGARE